MPTRKCLMVTRPHTKETKTLSLDRAGWARARVQMDELAPIQALSQRGGVRRSPQHDEAPQERLTKMWHNMTRGQAYRRELRFRTCVSSERYTHHRLDMVTNRVQRVVNLSLGIIVPSNQSKSMCINRVLKERKVYGRKTLITLFFFQTFIFHIVKQARNKK
ncbi:unnamed protein product [Linum trigynum]|uniref:Uncharacterized protein n=1 Tax=Linum trigynum TaxID=586398 RepID=A0AAV2FH54_9ROSI